jgi:uncharacterized protein (TIGR00266 family)
MQYQILKEPMAMLEIQLNKEEEVTGEAGAMVYIKGNIEVKTTTRSGGGFFKKFKVAALGRQSFFVNNYVAHEDNCFIGLTGPPIGDIMRMSINAYNAGGLIVQSGAYIASSPGIMLDTEWQGFKKGIFGSGLFMLKANGEGDLFVNAYGGIIQKNLKDNEKMILDNHHLVALSENSNYRVIKFGGLKTTILGGEGLVTEITGPGSVYFQTKNIPEFVDYLGIKQTSDSSSSTWRYDSNI